MDSIKYKIYFDSKARRRIRQFRIARGLYYSNNSKYRFKLYKDHVRFYSTEELGYLFPIYTFKINSD